MSDHLDRQFRIALAQPAERGPLVAHAPVGHGRVRAAKGSGGVVEIVEAATAPRGSFHYHFPGGKEELGVEAIGTAGRFVARSIDEAFDDAEDPAAGRRALARRPASLLEAPGWIDGCPVTGIACDTAGESEALRAAVADTFVRWRRRAARHAMRLGLDAASAGAFAERLLIELESAWIVARVQRSRAPFELLETS